MYPIAQSYPGGFAVVTSIVNTFPHTHAYTKPRGAFTQKPTRGSLEKGLDIVGVSTPHKHDCGLTEPEAAPEPSGM